MKFKIRNFGYIKDATLDVRKLTLICGKNNTGKSSIARALYGFLRDWRDCIGLSFADKARKELIDAGAICRLRFG